MTVCAQSEPGTRSTGTAWRPGETLLDLYEVREVLGEGGFGTVYRVFHNDWHADLAVKTPNQSSLERAGGVEAFEHEAQTWVQLSMHRHVVACHYVRRIEQVPSVFIEYVAGSDLQQHIASGELYAGGRDAALRRILDIAIQFAWGLNHAHEQKLIHQDVKPANLLLGDTGIAKVTDFGLASTSALSGDGRTLVATASGGTPLYFSPEQSTGGKVTRRSDLWGWAVSLLEMFCGGCRWPAGTVAGYYFEQHVQTGSGQDHIPDIPAALRNLLRACFRDDTIQIQTNKHGITRVLKCLAFNNVRAFFYALKEKFFRIRISSAKVLRLIKASNHLSISCSTKAR